jgi:hypothetical protein
VLELTGESAADEHYRAIAPRQMLLRMLQNLLGLAQGALRSVSKRSGSRSDPAVHQRHAGARSDARPRARPAGGCPLGKTGRRDVAVADIQAILDARPAGIDLNELRQMQECFRTNSPSP